MNLSHEIRLLWSHVIWAIQIISGFSLVEWLRYAIAASAAWLLFYVIIRRRMAHRKIVAGFPNIRAMAREAGFSLSTCIVYGIVGALLITPIRHGSTKLYFNLHDHSWLWFAASIAITIILHDTYFYWTHRAMHVKSLFPIIHRVHHVSTNPTPWASYSFHPIEAFIQAGIFPLAIFLYPIHPIAFMVFMIWQIAFNVIGHTGYEIHPRWLLDSSIGKWLNTPTNHTMHHQYFNGNYGLYFNVWDRLMGTNHRLYEERFREVTSRIKTDA